MCSQRTTCSVSSSVELALRIAQVSTCHEATPPTGYGSINRIVSDLTECLVSRGHEVTLFATGDSVTTAQLRSWFPSPSADFVDVGRDWLHSLFSLTTGESFDVVHNHNVYSGVALGQFAQAGAFVTTSHFFSDRDLDFYSYVPAHQFVALSDSQRARMDKLRPIAVIRPGIEPATYLFSAQKHDYLLMLGQIGDHKGTVEGIDVAQRLGLPLRIAGPIAPWNKEYYRDRVQPLLSSNIRYLGEVGGRDRLRLLRDARCLLFPSKEAETFGLVLLEAMASGTPAVALRKGAADEILIDGVTGYVCDDLEGMIDAVASCHEISARACRHHVRDHFHRERMTDDYLALYHRLLCEGDPA